jgi:hypothetical protein
MTQTTSVFASLALCLMMQGNAVGVPPDRWRQDPPDVSVEFLVAGHPLPQQAARGGPVFVAVPRWGIEYEIRITNHERHGRVLFVIGVDGLSVMDGSSASENSGGYVLEPGGSTRIRGWRRGLDGVAAFTFTHRDDSYAGRTGRRDHIGKVMVWAIREQSPVITPKPEAAGEKAAGRSAVHSKGDTGTGYGNELVDRVRTTHFARSGAVRCLNFSYSLRPTVEPDYQGGGSGGAYTPPPPGWKKKSP